MPAHLNQAEIAEAAGVSRQSVSLAINHPEKLRPATLEKIQKVIAERGYVPNQQARNLQKGRSFTLGMALRLYSDQDFTSAFLSQTLKGLHQASREAGYGIRLQTESTAESLESFFRSKAIDGLIYMSYRPESDKEVFSELLQNNRPFVLFGSEKSFPSVDMDLIQGATLVADKILERKKTRVLYIGGELDQPFNQVKLVAFQKRMNEKGPGWRSAIPTAAGARITEQRPWPTPTLTALVRMQSLPLKGTSLP
jgi:DNA-binding LacI/PurR family transcriptional regulator